LPTFASANFTASRALVSRTVSFFFADTARL
jgi:hypothetical protein